MSVVLVVKLFVAIVGMLPKNETFVKILQFRKAPVARFVTEGGIITLTKLLHPLNAFEAMLVMLLPIITLIILLSRLQALAGISPA